MNQPPIANYKDIVSHQKLLPRYPLYHRFSLSRRHVEEMLLERGITLFYERILRWDKNRASCVRRVHWKLPFGTNASDLNEVVVRINGKRCWL